MSLSKNIIIQRQQAITNEIKNYCESLDSVSFDDITIVAVSKKQPLDAIKNAFDCGIINFGENFVQEAITKIESFDDADKCIWHFIGPLQSNKTSDAAKYFSWIHSVDRIKIAQRLSNTRQKLGLAPINVCVQVNLGNEQSKSGIASDAVFDFMEEASKFEGIVIRGLMCIPEPTEDRTQKSKRFAQLADIFKQIKTNYPQLDTLSMGMSSDYLDAIAQGASMVRIGTKLFGERNYD